MSPQKALHGGCPKVSQGDCNGRLLTALLKDLRFVAWGPHKSKHEPDFGFGHSFPECWHFISCDCGYRFVAYEPKAPAAVGLVHAMISAGLHKDARMNATTNCARSLQSLPTRCKKTLTAWTEGTFRLHSNDTALHTALRAHGRKLRNVVIFRHGTDRQFTWTMSYRSTTPRRQGTALEQLRS